LTVVAGFVAAGCGGSSDESDIDALATKCYGYVVQDCKLVASVEQIGHEEYLCKNDQGGTGYAFSFDPDTGQVAC
jgi:hypothetical protein